MVTQARMIRQGIEWCYGAAYWNKKNSYLWYGIKTRYGSLLSNGVAS